MIWVKRISLGILATLLFLVVTILALLYTSSGAKIISWGAQKALPALSIGHVQGALLGDLQLNDVRYDANNINLAVSKLNLSLDDSCLLKSELCISNLGVNGVNFSMPTLPPESNAPKQSSKPLTKFSMPIPIRLEHVSLDNIDLDILSNQVSWQHFSTAIDVVGSQVTIKPTNWQGIRLKLAPTGNKPEKVASNKKSSVKQQSITLPDVVLPMSFDVKRFTVKDFELEGKAPQKVALLELIASAEGSNVKVDKLLLHAPQANLKATANITLSGDYPLQLNADAKIGMQPIKGEVLNLNASGSLAQLILDAKLSGKIDTSLKGKLSPLNPNLPFNMAISSQHLQWPIEQAAEYTMANTKINAVGDLKGFTFNAKSKVNGKAIPEVNLNFLGKGNLSQVTLSSLKIDTLGGTVTGNAKASWKDLVNWQGQLVLNHIQPGMQWPEAKGTLSGKLQTSGGLTAKGGWFVKLPVLSIHGLIMKQPLDLKGQLDVSDITGKDGLRLKTQGLSLKHGPNGLMLKGQLNKAWDMNAEINAPDLAKSMVGLRGKVFGNVKLSGSMSKPDLKLDLQGDDLAWQKLASLSSFNLQGNITPLPSIKADVILTATNARYETVQLNKVKVLLQGTEKDHHLSIDIKGKPVGTDLLITGDFNPKTGWQGTLQSGDITTPVGNWVLNHPTAIDYDLKTAMTTVAANCWQQGKASICLTKDLTAGASGDAELAVRQFNFDLIKPFLPSDITVEGEVGATVIAKWNPKSAPYVNAKLFMPAGGVALPIGQDEAPFKVGWDKVAVNLDMQDDVLNANWLVAIKNNGTLSGKGEITQLQGDKQIDANVKLDRFTLGFLEPIIKDYHQVGGQIDSNLQVTGPILHPSIDGLLQVSKLQATGRQVPLDIKNGSVKLSFKGYNAILMGDIETPDGQLSLRGNGDWKDMAAWNSALNINGKDLKVSVPPMVSLKVSPDLTLKASPKSVSIGGDVSIPWGRIIVNELPKSAIAVSKDQVILNDKLQPIGEKASTPLNITTNIMVHIGDDVKISAFGLKAGLLGNLNVRQEGKGPMIYGEINIAQGSYYRALGQDLSIRKGHILFNGSPEQPYLSMEAIRDPDNIEDGVIAGVKVTGPADAPEVSIFSDPAMPQQNALSYILTGRNLDNDGDGDRSNAMTTALIGLGLAQSSELVGDVGKAVGVRDLNLSTSGAGDSSKVNISGYIAPGLQVKFGVGIFNQVDEFTVRYRLMKNFYVEAVSSIDQAIDFLYQFDFN